MTEERVERRLASILDADVVGYSRPFCSVTLIPATRFGSSSTPTRVPSLISVQLRSDA